MAEEKLVLRIEANTSQVEAAFKRIQSDFSKLGGAGGSVGPLAGVTDNVAALNKVVADYQTKIAQGGILTKQEAKNLRDAHTALGLVRKDLADQSRINTQAETNAAREAARRAKYEADTAAANSKKSEAELKAAERAATSGARIAEASHKKTLASDRAVTGGIVELDKRERVASEQRIRALGENVKTRRAELELLRTQGNIANLPTEQAAALRAAEAKLANAENRLRKAQETAAQPSALQRGETILQSRAAARGVLGPAEDALTRAKGAQNWMRATAGNPFLVFATISKKLTGLAGIEDQLSGAIEDLNKSTRRFKRISRDLAIAEKTGNEARAEELRKQKTTAEGRVATDTAALAAAEGRARGPKYAIRAGIDFVTQQLLTGAMFTFAFQGAALVMTKLGEVATKAFTGLVAPAENARAALAQLSDSLQKAGGADTLKSMGLLSQAMYDMAKAAEAVARQKDVFVAISELQRATFAETLGGLSPAEAMFDTSEGWGPTSLGRGVYGEERQKWRESIEKYVGGSVEDINAAFKFFETEYNLDLSDIQKRFTQEYRQRMGGAFGREAEVGPTFTQAITNTAFDAVIEDITTRLTDMGLGVTKAADAAKQAATNFSSIRSDFMSKMDVGFRLASLTGKTEDLYAAFGKAGLPYQTGASRLAGPASSTEAGQFNQFISDYAEVNDQLITAQEDLTDRQVAATNAGTAAQWAQIRLQRAQIRATVAKSMIGAVGMSVFDLAAQIAEAREQARVSRLQLSSQEKQLRVQVAIAAASKKVADLSSIKSTLEASAQAAEMARSADANAYAKAINKSWTGNDKGEPIVNVLAKRIAFELKAE